MKKKIVLTDDLFSYGKGRKKYLSKGDIVDVFAEYESSYIVEDNKKEKFNVSKNICSVFSEPAF